MSDGKMTCPHCMNWSEEVRDAHREIERLTAEIGRYRALIDKALDEGYLPNEMVREELPVQGEQRQGEPPE